MAHVSVDAIGGNYRPLRGTETTETPYYYWRRSASMPRGHRKLAQDPDLIVD